VIVAFLDGGPAILKATREATGAGVAVVPYDTGDKFPGVIGKVGTILGEESINIADFSLGRRSVEKQLDLLREAIAVVHVDGQVPEQVLEKLRKIPAVQQAKAVRLF